ncbi:hypothetical protein [Anabaena sp. UHCC 0451]|uniref:hypothetical protein n=1 Tax=Anabaena sp. UHCC 0451 TaxID=2055235 RepID=UPI002B1F4B9B|nr:hypothetical protein [Anabaena sp. UHCC 0451]MEA5578629.1 hypothetical protein [Anabaena sp. UHCC 0451]
MSWSEYHKTSQKYASQAENLYRNREFDRAAESYLLAAEQEEKALNDLPADKTRTIGITAVSSASLYFKAREFEQAKRIANKYLATELLPPFAIEELKELLQAIDKNKYGQKTGIQFIESKVLISISGREIRNDATPLDDVVSILKIFSNLFYTICEMLVVSKHDTTLQEVKNKYNLWLVPNTLKSYQLTVSISATEDKLTQDTELQVENIIKKLMEIVKATTQDPEGELMKFVPDQNYQEIFMKLTRKLTLFSKITSFTQLEIKSNNDVEEHSVILFPETGEFITKALKKIKSRRKHSITPREIA